MQNLLIKETGKTNIKIAKKPLSTDDIEKFYLQGSKTDTKVGLEYERISLDKKTLNSASYEKLGKIIEHFASIEGWELIYDEDTIIGADNKKGTTISLEPGCQLEISLCAQKDIIKIDLEASKIIDLLDKIASIYDVIFLGYGITPKSNADEITILNKRRYKIMNEYLPYCSKGELCPKMMRQSAGIQINVDYKNKEDAYIKLKLFNLIMPFISGLCANSPIENNTLKENKSQRSQVWRYTGKDRCNLFYKNIFHKKLFKKRNLFKNYINEILDVPMVFIERDNEYIPIKGEITFKEFLKSGYKGYKAEYNDYITHQSLCFPDVRLKNYIEIRNHDSNTLSFALSLCALYKGICLGDINSLLKELSMLNINKTDEYFTLSSCYGLDFEIGNMSAWEIIEKIFKFSSKNLHSKERIYLGSILNLIKKRKTTSDIIIENNIKNANDLVDFL
ncbi:MAG: hypothetical protein IJ877_06920 [Candidatus Gastranaerophilales bacterium]|nr:hypothetical protein [Candidatus Gastranaerophilales bacterium]